MHTGGVVAGHPNSDWLLESGGASNYADTGTKRGVLHRISTALWWFGKTHGSGSFYANGEGGHQRCFRFSPGVFRSQALNSHWIKSLQVGHR